MSTFVRALPSISPSFFFYPRITYDCIDIPNIIMAGAYTDGCWVLGAVNDDLPINAYYQWSDADLDPNAPVQYAYCKRCSKSIARSRCYKRPDHRACSFCHNNHNPGCELVSPSLIKRKGGCVVL